MEALDDLGDQPSDLKLVEYLLLSVLGVNDLVEFKILTRATAALCSVLPRSTLPLVDPAPQKNKH